ncbi:ATP-grasp domain-containing protein [Actinoplanes sp. KI2]|uniref:ATP-grasp domain-containing protein n=1 Tax=Actinoplanes sp. KI2 TaxID=2983315 RepID=UPI0021D58D32|nr:ATP-grasp domain-containing protein [Actinoplanes sp. KI2]MCU7725245.1 ATP-grasp domain-containing protein [Actinoplanes sp. KI2]
MLRSLDQILAGKRLVWLGVRGVDAWPLAQLRAFTDCFSLTQPLRAQCAVLDCSLETRMGRRFDLNTFEYDFENMGDLVAWREVFESKVSRYSATFPYKGSRFSWEAQVARGGRDSYLGLFADHQACFDNRVWIDAELQAQGIRILPWQYARPGDADGRVYAAVAGRPQVIRLARSSGGSGVDIAETPEDVDRLTGSVRSQFSYTDYLEASLPLNVGATVDHRGVVTVHGVSVQLVGVESCIHRRLGYCGNDFALVKDLDKDHLSALDRLVGQVGRWLASSGYRGAYGMDALLHRGQIYFLEVNPRFQGSSGTSARLSRELDLPDIYLSHLAAFLRIDQQPTLDLEKLVHEQAKRSVVHLYNGAESVRVGASESSVLSEAPISGVPAPNVVVDPLAALCSVTFECSVTASGYTLRDFADAKVNTVLGAMLIS